MGTTYDALKANEGVPLVFTVLIEGFNYVLTDHWDTDAIVTAYTGTDWTQALCGLEHDGIIEQRIRPWSNAPEVPVIRFRMVPDEDDVFGTAVFKTSPTAKTRLYKTFHGDDGTVTVEDQSNFSAGADIFVGRQVMGTDSLSGTDKFIITAGDMGKMAPFNAGTADANRYPRSSYLPNAYSSGDTAGATGWWQGAPSYVSDGPMIWTGKHVGLWAHRIVNGVVDTYAQAHLCFAGILKQISDGPDGVTMECEDLGRSLLRDGMILGQQFVGFAAEGVYLEVGDYFNITEDTSTRVGDSTLTVVAGTPASVYEVQEGFYTADDLVSAFNSWFNDALNVSAEITGDILFEISNNENPSTIFRATYSSGVAGRTIELYASNTNALEQLGFTSAIKITSPVASTQYGQRSDTTPWKVRPFGAAGWLKTDRRMSVRADVGGFLVNQVALMPQELQNSGPQNGNTWAICDIGPNNERMLCEFSGSYGAAPGNILRYIRVNAIAGSRDAPLAQFSGIPYGSEEVYEIRQVLVLTGTVTDLIARFFLAMDGNGLNHATYDDVGPGFGVGIPYSLLSTPFLNSLAAIGSATENDQIAMIVDAPTRLIDLVEPEMALRMAWFVFKEGTYRFVLPPTPNPLTPDFELTENNKAGKSGDRDDLRTETVVDGDSMRNIIKVLYDIDPVTGEYRKTAKIINDPSVSDYGPLPVTIKATTAYNRWGFTGSNVEELAATLAARTLPVFGRPLRKFVRTVNFNIGIQIAPGDSVTLTDSHARNPVTGQRGITARACTVLATRFDFGHTTGSLLSEVELMYWAEERIFPLSIGAEIDETAGGAFTAGYDSGTPKRIKLKQHACSPSSASADAYSYNAGDLIDIVEIDPADPAAPQEWLGVGVDVVDAANDILEIDTALTGHSSSKIYRVRPTTYPNAQASQQLKTFQALSTTGLIDSGGTDDPPHQYGEKVDNSISTTRDATRLSSLIPTSWGADASALDAGLLRDLCDTANNLINYRQNLNMPMMTQGFGSPLQFSAFTADVWTPYWIFRLPNLGGPPSAGLKRQLNIAPGLESTGAGTVYVRVTVSRVMPDGTGSTGWTFRRGYSQQTWSLTGVQAAAVGTLWQVDIPSYIGTVILVELSRNSTGGGYFYGLSKLYTGPLIAA